MHRYRGMASVSDTDREALLNKMLPIADFRVYDNPAQLASQVDDLVSEHQDRLLDGRAQPVAGTARSVPPGRGRDGVSA